MTDHRRPGRLALVGGIALALGLAGHRGGLGVRAGSRARPRSRSASTTRTTDPSQVTVAAGIPVTFVLRNDDPIDHEWIVGDAAVHERHRTGTEPVHGSRPTEVSIPAGSSRETTVTLRRRRARYLYICHLPGHEAYGMVGTLVVTGD